MRDALERWLKTTSPDATPEELVASLAEALGVKHVDLDVLTHELRGPLATIAGSADVLRRDPGADRATLASRLAAAAAHCRAILDDPAMAATGGTCDAGDALDAAIALLDAPDGLRVETASPPAATFVRGDRHHVVQIVLNLLRNASQAQGGAGKVRVTAQTADDLLLIAVDDDGPGVPDELSETVFEAGVSTKKDRGGSGIGLAVSRRIARGHGGDLVLEPSDGGARFVLSLPIARAPEKPTETTVPATEPGAMKVLLVDDDTNTLETYQRVLALDGHDVECVTSGAEGLARLLGNGTWDAVLVDVRLPDIEGPELYRRVLAERPAAARRIIFATGDLMNEHTKEFLDGTGNPYLVKPFQIDELRTALHLVRDAAR